jgi:hypothetical protein
MAQKGNIINLKIEESLKELKKLQKIIFIVMAG